MIFKYLKIIIVLLLLSSLQSNAQKIPITSISKDAIAFYEKGWKLENKLKIDAAEAAYKNAILSDSTFALAHLRLGMVRDNYDFRKEKLKDALKYIDKISEAEKLWIKARVDFYAIGYDGSKEYSYFKQLVESYPNDEVANYWFGFVNFHHGGNDIQKTIKHYKKSIQINPKYIAPYNDLAYAYAQIGDYVNAKKTAKKYSDLLPTSINPLDTYAEILMRSGAYEQSIEAYKKVLELDPEFPWALMGIMANLNFLDRHNDGRVYLEKLNESKLSDYEYRHKWRAKVVSYIDEGDLANAINTLEEQKQASISGKNKREPKFHIYYTFLRKTRLYFEDNQSDKGLNEYYKWKNYIQENYKSEKTKQRIKNLNDYYLAYKAYNNNELEKSEDLLNNFELINGKKTNQSKTLRAKIYLKQKKYSESISQLKDTDLSNSYNQYWLMRSLIMDKNYDEAKIWKDKILNLNERNNINLALIRQKAKKINLKK